MTSGKSFEIDYPDHLYAWLELAQRRLGTAVREVSENLPEIRAMRPRQLRALQLIPRDGIRVSDLAELVGTTKQAAGQLVTAMEQNGVVTSVPAPADGRVRMIVRTERGDEVSATIDDVVGRAELLLRAEIGARSYDTMRRSLRLLGLAAIHSKP
jgi:DNA-binding MarR family transcriptional regulator